MNWFESIIAQAEAEVVKIETTAQTVAPAVKTAIADAKAAITSPAAQELISLFQMFTTHTSTPGAAVITEPKVVAA